MNRRAIHILSVVSLLICIAAPCVADTEMSFPLHGGFRPGKYMPVRIVTTDAAPVTLFAAGAVPTTLSDPTPGIRTIVPFLPIRSQLGAISSSSTTRPATEGSPQFRSISPTERLIGIAGGSADFAERVLFTGSQVIEIDLDAADPLPGPIAAWEALDALLVDQFPDPARTTALLAAGTTIAVNSSASPTDGFAWERIEDYWVLRHPISGPAGVLISEGYNPAPMWNPGHPWSYRRQVLLMSVALCILVLAAALWRSRWVTITCVGIAIAGSIAVVVWRRAQSPVMEANGAVIIASDSFTQRDDWMYRRSLESNAKAPVSVSGLIKPILDNERQIEQTGLHLAVTPADRNTLEFSYVLSPRQMLAFVARRVTPGRWPGAPSVPARTPIVSLRDLYLDPSTELRGQVPDALPGNESPPANVERWPALYIDRLKSAPSQRTLQP